MPFRITSLASNNAPVGIDTNSSTPVVRVNGPVQNWDIKRAGKDTYQFSIGPFTCGEENDRVVAKDNSTPPTEWRVVPQPQAGPGVYSIQRTNEELVGWYVADSQDPVAPILVRPLPATRSIPPQVLLPGLFRISPPVQ